jgi:hypothetical protein
MAGEGEAHGGDAGAGEPVRELHQVRPILVRGDSMRDQRDGPGAGRVRGAGRRPRDWRMEGRIEVLAARVPDPVEGRRRVRRRHAGES